MPTKTNRRKPKEDLSYIAPGLRALAVPVKTLKVDPENARQHPERNLQALTDDLLAFGQQKPLVAGPGGVVIAGNGLLMAARRLEWTHVAVVRTNLKGMKRRAFAIADNRTGELSEWDDLVLAEQLDELAASAPADLEKLGFTEDELADLFGGGDPETTPDETDEGEPTGATRQAADVNFSLGGYRFVITRKKYDKWQEAIRQKVGFDEKSILTELKRRLKL